MTHVQHLKREFTCYFSACVLIIKTYIISLCFVHYTYEIYQYTFAITWTMMTLKYLLKYTFLKTHRNAKPRLSIIKLKCVCKIHLDIHSVMSLNIYLFFQNFIKDDE